MTEVNDVLVEDYLARVSRAGAGLPVERRDELLSDLREHIEAGRSELEPETEAQVRQILDRLGDPADIARAAAEDGATAPVYPPPIPPMPPRRRSNVIPIIVTIAVIVVLLALVAGLLFFAQSSSTVQQTRG